MNVLVYMPTAFNACGSNDNIVLLVSKELIKRGHKVLYYSLNSKGANADLEEKIKDGIKFYLSSNSYQRKLDKLKIGSDWDVMTSSQKLIMFFKYPSLLFQKLKWELYGKHIIDDIVRKDINYIIEKEDINVILTVSMPFSTSLFIADFSLYTPVFKVMYQLDPHSDCWLTVNKEKALEEELRILEKFDLVFTTDLIYRDDKKSEKSKYIEKIYPLEYPNVRKLEFKKTDKLIRLDEYKINCFYCGKLYDDIRNPKFLLETFLNIKNKNIVLHIMGKGSEEIIEAYKRKMGERLVIHGQQSIETAFEVMLRSDILISIGNHVNNMVPGKIFDYISTGKPILNFYQIPDCTSLKYLERYPLCLNLYQGGDLRSDEVESFCVENRRKHIKFDIIKDLFCDNKVCEVVNKMENILRINGIL